MKIFLFQNSAKVHDEDPAYIVRIQIGDTWHDAGTATKGTTAKGTGYFEQDIDDEILVDKLKDIDWIAKGPKTQEFLAEKDREYKEKHYPSKVDKNFAEV